MKHSAVFRPTRFVDPIWITVGLWLAVITGTAVSDLNPLSLAFILVLFIGISSHVAGMACHRIVYPLRSGRDPVSTVWPLGVLPSRATVRHNRKANNRTLLFLVFIATCVGFFGHAYLEIIPSLDGVGFLAARAAYLEEVRGERDKLFLYTTHLTLLGITVVFYAARAYAQATVEGMRTSRILVNVTALVTFAASIMTTGRTAPLLVILSYSFFCLRFRIFSKRSIIATFGVSSVAMFVLIAFALGKEGLGDSDADGAMESLANLGRIYFFSAPVAVQDVILNDIIVSNACSNIFSYPIDLAKKFGFFSHCDVRELDFVFVPVATNVYTFLRAYWEDFRWAFPLAMFATGFLIEAVHRSALSREGYSAFVYPFLLNALLLQIFEEQLFANGSVFAYLTLLYFVLGKLYPDRKIPSVHQLRIHRNLKLTPPLGDF